MGDMTGVLFKFGTDSTDNIQLIQNNIDQVKKAVRKMCKKYDVFSPKVVTRQIKLLDAGEEKEVQLRIAPNVDIIYTTSDQTYKGDWEALGHLTVYVELSNRDFEAEEKNKSSLVEETLEELHELKSRIDKLETMVNSTPPVQRNLPIKSAAKKAAPVVNSLAHPITPKICSPPMSAPNKSTVSAPPVKTPPAVSKYQTTPKKPVSTPKPAPLKAQIAVNPPARVNLNANISSQTTASQKHTPVKPALTKRAPISKKETATAYLVPYNVSRPSNTPQTMANSTPHTNGVPASTNILKRALNVSGETLGTPTPQKKPRQEPVSDPGALLHLEAIIDSVAAGLENPDDFSVEAPYFVSRTGESHSVEQEHEQVFEYTEFAESLPKKKKKSKKQRHSKGEGEADLTI